MTFIVFVWIALYQSAFANLKSERDYQLEWCAEHGGRTEITLSDRTRVDCLFSNYAVEMDFADKWAEAPFQAMHYARLTGLNPGIVIICRKKGDVRKLKRLRDNLNFYNLDIKLWTINCK